MSFLPEKKIAYTIPEACHMLSISKAHIYRLIAAKELPAFKVGRRTLIAANRLQDFVNKKAA